MDNDDTGFPWPHLALRAACFDPRHARLPMLSDAERDVVWRAVEKEVCCRVIFGVQFQAVSCMQVSAQLPGLNEFLVKGLTQQLRDVMTRIEPTLDPAEFWTSDAAAMLSCLGPVASAMLGIPASSVDPERGFSSAGFIEDELRARMADTTLCMSVVVRDWYFSFFDYVDVVSVDHAQNSADEGYNKQRRVLTQDGQRALLSRIRDALASRPAGNAPRGSRSEAE